jgi:Fe-S-cluster containining protein
MSALFDNRESADSTKKFFYACGLRFSCRRCSDCCRHEPGFVFLSANDVEALAQKAKMGYDNLVQTYCRWVSVSGSVQQLSLREKTNFDCIFWKDGCTVYESRPLQCRTFPFWASSLVSPSVWKNLCCPGIGTGKLCSRDYIEACLEQRKAEPLLMRKL